MREKVEAHKEQEYRHREAGKDFRPFEPKRVSDRGSLPDFEVVEDVNSDAYCSRYSVEKYQV